MRSWTTVESRLKNWRSQRFPLAVLLFAWVSVCGCAPRPAHVVGTVTLPNGNPAVGVTVVFDDPAKQISASGSTDSAGNYQLTTNDPNDGAFPGEYAVTVHQPHAADSSQPEPPRMFSKRYESRETSGLKFVVKPGDNTFDIKLEPL